jgi:hypothetical protein
VQPAVGGAVTQILVHETAARQGCSPEEDKDNNISSEERQV